MDVISTTERIRQDYDAHKSALLYQHCMVETDKTDPYVWHFLLSDIGAPLESGEYYGILQFPTDYPQTQPTVSLHTPNGRLKTNFSLTVLNAKDWSQAKALGKIFNVLLTWLRGEPGSEPPPDGALNSQMSDIINLAKTSDFFNKQNAAYLKHFGPVASEVQSNEPLLTDDDLLLGINEEVRKLLPSLCQEPAEALILPKFTILDTGGTKSGLPCVKLGVVFSGCPYLKEGQRKLKAPEDFREHTRSIIVTILDKVMDYGISIEKRFSFVHVDLSETEASMRAIFNGTCDGRVVHRESEVEVLNLSRTKTSKQALPSLYRLRNLRELYLDHCPSLVETGRQVFSNLSAKDPIPNLELLSIVETSSILSHTWLSEIQSSCPKLDKIIFTRKKGTKALGWHDTIMMQTMRKPQLLPCGHIGDRDTLLQFMYCSFDRQPFRPNDLMALHPAMSSLYKDKKSNAWTTAIIDYGRKPLDSKTLYHVCGCFFNFDTLLSLFPDIKGHTNINDQFIHSLKDKECPHCRKHLAPLRVCYPHSAEAIDAQDFGDLKQFGAYSIAGLTQVMNNPPKPDNRT